MDTEVEKGVRLDQVRDWWNDNVCGSQNASAARFSKEYFDEIEAHRFRQEDFIFSFAQFTRFRGQKVLEVGIGAGTDFLQWARAGAQCSGVDLTEQGIRHAERRLQLEGLSADLRVGNAEKLGFPDDQFDLVYSWGVIHHSPSIPNALREIVRVIRPGGKGKLMLYNRRSLTALYIWTRWALLKGRPWRSISHCLSSYVESPGTKAVTIAEVRDMLRTLGVRDVRIRSVMTSQDRLDAHPAVRWFGRRLAHFVDNERFGWFLLVEFEKPVA